MKSLSQLLKEANIRAAKISPQIRRADRTLRARTRELEAIEKIREVAKGLRETKAMYSRKFKGDYDDPGKYSTAYYYAKEITEEDITDSENFRAALTRECSFCHSQVPVIMSYKQTYDGPDRDTWQKKAFYICCGKVNELKTVTSGDRF